MKHQAQISRPRVLVDGYYLGKPSGYGRFISELCGALGDSATELEFLVAVTRKTGPEVLPRSAHLRYVVLPDSTFPIWEQFVIPACAKRHGCSVIHFPYNTSAILGGRAKAVVTVHDVTFLDSNNERDWKSTLIHAYMKVAFNLGTRFARSVISVSETTRSRLMSIGVASDRVYNTVDGFVATEELGGDPGPVRPYFIHRGSYAATHRNTERVIDAFLRSSSLTQSYTLKILGVPDGKRHWPSAVDQPVEFLPRVTDAELAAIYRGSVGVIATSLLEGFCLPIVEAFGFGVPVVASDIDPMKEIAGAAALLVSPYDVDAITRAMDQLTKSSELAADLVRRGRDRYRSFSKSAMMDGLLPIYRMIVSEK